MIPILPANPLATARSFPANSCRDAVKAECRPPAACAARASPTQVRRPCTGWFDRTSRCLGGAGSLESGGTAAAEDGLGTETPKPASGSPRRSIIQRRGCGSGGLPSPRSDEASSAGANSLGASHRPQPCLKPAGHEHGESRPGGWRLIGSADRVLTWVTFRPGARDGGESGAAAAHSPDALRHCAPSVAHAGVRGGIVAALLAFGLFAGVPTDVHAQTETTFVSNLGQSNATAASASSSRAQAFTTGTHAPGYNLSSVQIGYRDLEGDAFSATVWTVDSSGNPSTLRYSLTPPISFPTITTSVVQPLTFTAPAGATLEANTTYTIMMTVTVNNVTIGYTTSDAEDVGASPGWSIRNQYHFRDSGTWKETTTGRSYFIAVQGSAIPDTTAPTAAVEAGLTARFENVPESHDGSSVFDVRVVFSDGLPSGSAGTGGRGRIKHSLVVTGGTHKKVWKSSPPARDEYWIRVKPSGNGAVTVSLPAQTDCEAAGAVCTPEGAALASPVSATVPGPASLTPEVSIASADDSQTRSVTADSSLVTEGTAAEFTLTRTGSLADALTVNVSVTETGAMLSGTVPETVTFNANSSTAELRVETEDDEVAEPASVVTAAVAAGSGYAMDSSAASASVTVEDDDAAPVMVPEVQTTLIFTVQENTTTVDRLIAVDDDTPATALAWSIVGGADAAMFTISAGGNLAFASAKDFEAPDDADADGDYEVTVRVTDGANSDDTALIVRLTDVVGGPDEPPVHTGPISVSVQCVDPAYRVDAIESIVWDMHFSAPVRALQETGGARPYEMAGQDDTDFAWFAAWSPDAEGLDGPRYSSYRFFTTPRVPRPDGLHSAVVSDVNGVVITVPAGGWQDRSGNLNFNTASANALYLAHNWKVSVADASADASATEGTDGTIDFEVTLNARDDCKTVTVDWTTADGTATAGEDYAAASGTLTFGPGETSKTIRVALLETVDVGGAEAFSVQLGNASGIALDDAEAIGTIFGEDVPANGQPTVTGAARVGEALTASASGITDENGLANATFAWQWIANDGTSDADIAGATAETYTLTPTETGKTIKVRVTFTDDGGTEETLVSEATAAVTSALPSVSVAAVSSPVTEGTAAAFTLSRTGDTTAALTVPVSVTETGSVLSGTPANSVTFAAGSAEAPLSVATVDDSVAEADARVTVAVTAGSGYQVGSGSGSAGVDVYDNDEVASAPVKTLWTSTLEWQGDYGAGWVNANEEDFSTPGWSEDGDDYSIWYIAYGSSKDELWVRTDPNMRAGGIPASGELTLQVGHVTVESAGTMAKFARGDITIVRGIEQSWAVGEQVQVRLTRTTAGETTVSGPGVSVADAQAQEAEGAVLAFRVTLAEAQTSAVSVRYATSDGTATAGTDYVSVSGALRFAPGETSKTVSVPVLNDDHDEGSETMTLTLSNAFGAQIADGTATGTIVNTDPMPQAWMARFGRTVAEQVIGAVEGRFSASRTAGVEMTLAGERIGGTDAEPEAAEARSQALAEREAHGKLEAMAQWLQSTETGDGGEIARVDYRSRAVTSLDLLTGSSFALTGESASGGMMSLWGRGAVSQFDGREGDLSLDGEVSSVMLGADWAKERWTAGLLVSRSEGEGGYLDPEAEPGSVSGMGGKIESTLTGLFPYGRYAASDRLTLWGIAGYGTGELTLTPEDQSAIRTDMDLMMGAVGLHRIAVEAPTDGGIELAVKTDALAVRTTTDEVRGDSDDTGNLAATEADVTRLRLGLEGTWRSSVIGDGGRFEPGFEIGLRHDGGDAETGFGLDLGVGLAWSNPQNGITAELRGRGLLTHEADGFRERGIAGSFGWDPDPGTDRGPLLTLTRSMGASATGGADALFGRTTLAGLAANDPGSESGAGDDDLANRRLELRMGYGFGAFGDRFTMTPEFGMGLSNGNRDYALGWRLVRRTGDRGSAELSFEARRSEGVDSAPRHGVGLTFIARF